ncbi:hypothetical protein N7494_007708 [Penicillium frequentans]|uniref:Uncharacterized protein n=1 Tax=Penicillium frequentans TaxID=3151616 RepID=A0AAD6GEG4_9EURO|nr:hypothetical protein N7494_007708 [Penicillium glabrum]
MCLQELICRAEDPRTLFAELHSLLKDTQGNNLTQFELSLSRYLLANDNISRRQLICELEETIKKFKPAAEDDVCVYTRRCGLIVLNGLYRSFPEYATECLQNEKTIHALGSILSFSPTLNHQGRRFERYSKADDRALDIYREKDEWYEDESRHRLRRLESYEMEEPDRRNEMERRDKAVQQELREFEYQERLAVGKEEIKTRIRQEVGESRKNSSKTGAADQQDKTQKIQLERIKRQPTVTDFDEPQPRTSTLSNPLVESAEVGIHSDEDTSALAIISRPQEPPPQ